MTSSSEKVRAKVASPVSEAAPSIAMNRGDVSVRGSATSQPQPQSTAEISIAAPGQPFPETLTRRRWGLISFIVAVVMPTAACLLYLTFFAASQYVSEARFVVRGSLQNLSIESVGQAATLSALNNSQEAHVVADYVRSPQIVDDLARDYDLRKLFAGSPFDVIWHLPGGASADRLARYWKTMASADVDTTTGIITIKINAFSPQEAQDLTRSVIALCEKLVANFSQTMRAERLEQALSDSKAAQAEMDALLTALETARGREATLDPLASATALTKLVSSLRDERATLAASRAAAASRLNANAPTISLADERIRSLDAQIELILSAATQTAPSAATQAGPGTASTGDLLSATSLFDILQTRRELVARHVARAETALAQAKQDTIRQQIYVDMFMPPTLAQIRIHPEILQMTLILGLSLAAIWGVAALYFETIRERTR